MTENERMLLTKYDLLFESRLTRVETTIEILLKDVKEIKAEMKTDFKFYMYVYFTGMVGLAGLMAKGFNWFN